MQVLVRDITLADIQACFTLVSAQPAVAGICFGWWVPLPPLHLHPSTHPHPPTLRLPFLALQPTEKACVKLGVGEPQLVLPRRVCRSAACAPSAHGGPGPLAHPATPSRLTLLARCPARRPHHPQAAVPQAWHPALALQVAAQGGCRRGAGGRCAESQVLRPWVQDGGRKVCTACVCLSCSSVGAVAATPGHKTGRGAACWPVPVSPGRHPSRRPARRSGTHPRLRRAAAASPSRAAPPAPPPAPSPYSRWVVQSTACAPGLLLGCGSRWRLARGTAPLPLPTATPPYPPRHHRSADLHGLLAHQPWRPDVCRRLWQRQL